MIVLSLIVLAFVGLADSGHHYNHHHNHHNHHSHHHNHHHQIQGCQVAYDRCGQRCCIEGGRLVKCTRIRKEFTSMTIPERRRHIRTILKVSTKRRFKHEYESLINEHYTLFDTLIHKVEFFLPWHRYFILRYENLMRKADCRFTVAYWDWSLDTREPFSTDHPIDDVWHSWTGFGGNGVGKDLCVQTGPFRQGVWSRVAPYTAGPGPHCLRRNFTGEPEERIDLEEVLKMDNFSEFEYSLRILLHNNVHCNIEGTMCTKESASAPEFFLHHGFIDKIWDDWQKKSPAHKNAYFPSVNLGYPMYGTVYSPKDLIDLSKQPDDSKQPDVSKHPGYIRVEYEPFKKEEDIRKLLKGKTAKQLRKMKRRPFTGLNKDAIKLFRLSAGEVKKVRALEKKLDPNVIES